jgi:hypothetical protein
MLLAERMLHLEAVVDSIITLLKLPTTDSTFRCCCPGLRVAGSWDCDRPGAYPQSTFPWSKFSKVPVEAEGITLRCARPSRTQHSDALSVAKRTTARTEILLISYCCKLCHLEQGLQMQCQRSLQGVQEHWQRWGLHAVLVA